ncbi:MAG: hypothetical protein HYY85_11930 [Deltaproteobacteria bacterium]|nr:hypothetical protein [Deltaproteobacteria bacterium]
MAKKATRKPQGPTPAQTAKAVQSVIRGLKVHAHIGRCIKDNCHKSCKKKGVELKCLPVAIGAVCTHYK